MKEGRYKRFEMKEETRDEWNNGKLNEKKKRRKL